MSTGGVVKLTCHHEDKSLTLEKYRTHLLTLTVPTAAKVFASDNLLQNTIRVDFKVMLSALFPQSVAIKKQSTIKSTLI